MGSDAYTVTLRGESFTLFRDQIQFDSPNLFTETFLGSSSSAQSDDDISFLDGSSSDNPAPSPSSALVLSRSPALFRVIIEYLSGYTVLPLSHAMIPETMTAETARQNLLRDAQAYKLQALVKLLEPVPPPVLPKVPPVPREQALSSLRIAPGEPLDLAHALGEKRPSDLVVDGRGVGKVVDGDFMPVMLHAKDILMVYVLLTCAPCQWSNFRIFSSLLHRHVKRFWDSSRLSPIFTPEQLRTLGGKSAFSLKGTPITVDGREYLLPCTFWRDSATLRVNEVDIAAAELDYLCQNMETDKWTTRRNFVFKLGRAYEEENKMLVLWCSRVLFTLMQEKPGVPAVVRVFGAEGLSRDHFVSAVAAS